jgi:hypothetical protein
MTAAATAGAAGAMEARAEEAEEDAGAAADDAGSAGAAAPGMAEADAATSPAARPSEVAEHHRRAKEHREKRVRGFVEIAATVLLGLAAVLTAWSAYQAVVHSGASLEAFSESSLKAVEAQKNLSSGDLLWTEDMIVFLEYQKALRSGDTAFADELKGLMSQNLIDGIAWWQAQPSPRPPNPFVEGSPEWTNEYYEKELALENAAAEAFAQAQKDGAIGDQFTLATVLFAVVLFFAGIATAVRRPAIAASALTFGLIVFAAATVHLLATHFGA